VIVRSISQTVILFVLPLAADSLSLLVVPAVLLVTLVALMFLVTLAKVVLVSPVMMTVSV
jgi:hypothetical protein